MAIRCPTFAGLSRRAPVLSFCMLIFLLSLAGIPPLAGFFGKFYVFSAVLSSTTGSLGSLAGGFGDCDERGFALLLPEGVEVYLCD